MSGGQVPDAVVAAGTGRTVTVDTPGDDTCVGTVVVPRAGGAPAAGLFCRKVQPAVSTRRTTSEPIRRERDRTIMLSKSHLNEEQITIPI
jgi:hypothetical protein